MSSVEARKGRHRQRYENNLRLVSGCIPYRLSKEDKDQSGEKEKCIEVLMISSPNRDDLVFPKGGWEDDGTVLQAASREALEEAGVKGTLNAGKSPWILGIQKQKQTEHLQPGRRLQRLKVEDAFRLCWYEWMRMALNEFLIVIAEDEKL